MARRPVATRRNEFATEDAILYLFSGGISRVLDVAVKQRRSTIDPSLGSRNFTNRLQKSADANELFQATDLCGS